MSCEEILQRTTAYYESIQRTEMMSAAARGSYYRTTDQDDVHPPPEFLGQARACLNTEAQIAAVCYLLSSTGTTTIGGWALGRAITTLGKAAAEIPKRPPSTSKRPPTLSKAGQTGVPKNSVELPVPPALAAKVPGLRLFKVGKDVFQFSTPDVPDAGLLIREMDGNTMSILSLEVDEKFQKLGLARSMFEQALSDSPSINHIEVSVLSETNLEVLKKWMARGLTAQEALRKTPAYRIRSRIGFSEIVPGSLNPNYGFTVRRPQPLPTVPAVQPRVPLTGSPVVLVVTSAVDQRLAADEGE